MRHAALLASSFALALAVTAAAGSAHAGSRPYVVLQDDGTIEHHALVTLDDLTAIRTKMLALYDATGQPLPEILSVWTTFPLGPDVDNTVFDALGNDVQGIGLEAFYPPDGKLVSPLPPLRSVLWHNDVLELPKRAAHLGAPLEGFADYLFLLECFHNWGPAINVPGADPTELVGFPFHWSFWMDAGGSPAGGNGWKDNGDGTFTAVAADPKTLAYSKLDLYLMGLAGAAEVPPFGVLEGAVPPAGLKDQVWGGGAYAAHSFPWFNAAMPFTATATRRTLTIDDVVTTNGARQPAVGASPTSWKLGVVLITSSKDTAATTAAARQVFDPVAASFAPAFHTATANRGTLDVVTQDPLSGGTGGAGGSGAGGSGGASAGSTGSGGGAPASGACGCRADGGAASPEATGALGLALVALAARRRRGRRGEASRR